MSLAYVNHFRLTKHVNYSILNYTSIITSRLLVDGFCAVLTHAKKKKRFSSINDSHRRAGIG